MPDLYDFDTVLFPFNRFMHMARGMGARLLDAAKARNMGILCMKRSSSTGVRGMEFFDAP